MALPRLFAIEAGCRPIDRAADENDLGRLRGAFDQIATVFGEADECLPRSLAFRRLAFRCGHRPSLVIGVKIDPFGAHCWVQSGARLDNDRSEEHTSELQSLMRISYAVFCLKKKKNTHRTDVIISSTNKVHIH